MPDLSELLRKIESASGADRELDAKLRYALIDCRDFKEPSYDWTAAIKAADEMDIFVAERYTASIDAALALVEHVLPGWQCSSANHTNEYNKETGDWQPGLAWAALFPPDNRNQWRCENRSQPLAILAALIRAKLSEQGEGER